MTSNPNKMKFKKNKYRNRTKNYVPTLIIMSIALAAILLFSKPFANHVATAFLPENNQNRQLPQQIITRQQNTDNDEKIDESPHTPQNTAKILTPTINDTIKQTLNIIANHGNK